MTSTAKSATRRPPLGEATRRVNNAQQQPRYGEKLPAMSHHESRGLNQNLGLPEFHHPARESSQQGSNAVNPRLSAIAKEYPASNRNSQISTTSTNSEGKRLKSYIGPWKLGKTLGKGATARVRLARHAVTGQEAAVKIVQKKNAQLSQAGSLAELDKAESRISDSEDGVRRMPVGIEREVAIMKLIQHPNIMKLHDIWENRTEIYLVLEYVENGELFDHISNSRTGNLPEEEALRCFRQILSAVGYCHSFHICHRDLKPENILLTKTGQIKIADFGMAALHQGPDHKLMTSCGSPHYAAPELIRGCAYKGDLVDVWSMGVILYATLAGRLPFDVDGGSPNQLAPLLAKIKKGQYEMPAEFSNEAKSLIKKMLQVNPKDRITLPQIWKHALLRKYDYLDDLSGGGFPQSPSLKQCGRPVLKRSDISKELLRNLRSMWHRMSEQQLMDALLSDEPNEQKLFYSLLVKYRDAQLENYTPDIEYSASDYHHIKPLNLTKTYSTCQFQPTKLKGHARQASKFTVISNAAETERSYDPFKASRPQHLNGTRDDRIIVTIHRGNDNAEGTNANAIRRQESRSSSIAPSVDRKKQQSLAPPRFNASRSSMASSTRSRTSNHHARAGLTYKRGVSFSHIRRNSFGSQPKRLDDETPTRNGRHSNNTVVTDDGSDVLRAASSTNASARYIRSKKSQTAASGTLPSPVKPGRASLIWGEDVRQLSSSLAKDCDEAFNRTSMVSDVETSEARSSVTKASSFSRYSSNTEPSSHFVSAKAQLSGFKQKPNRSSLDERPLPKAPTRTESVEIELREARRRAELRKRTGDGDSPRYLDRMVSHIDELIQPISPGQDRRVTSAPVDSRRVSIARPLPSIYETRCEEPSPRRTQQTSSFSEQQRRVQTKSSRTASAPEPRDTGRLYPEDLYTRPNSLARDTIRVVNSSTTFESPVKAPAPLYIRKKSSQTGPPAFMSGALGFDHAKPLNWHKPSGIGLREQYQATAETPRGDLGRIADDANDEYDISNQSSSGTIVKKKSGWFKRNSKSEVEDCQVSLTDDTSVSNNDFVEPPYERPGNPHLVTPPAEAPKKKGFSFGRLFKKRNSKPDMAVSAFDAFDDNASAQDSVTEYQHQFGRGGETGDGRVRQIAPQRNWLAKLFNVKPPARFICFSVSKRKARREITILLKDWKRYGIQDIQIDKERNIVFGRVAAQNHLQMKEVAFAGEVMTVIEHGKRSHLSIARFTQEQGAASSFQKVVETLEAVFKCRGVLVQDERKKRMMIKTLTAA